MRLNTLLLSSVLTLFASINANPVPQVQRLPIDVPDLPSINGEEKWEKWKDQVSFKHAPNIELRPGDYIPAYDCTEAERRVDVQEQNCYNANANALFYRNHPWNCQITHVCFIPCFVFNKLPRGTIIESKYYCKADYSSVNSCKYGTIDYDFDKCLEETSTILGFSYNTVQGPILPIIKEYGNIIESSPSLKDLQMKMEGDVKQRIN